VSKKIDGYGDVLDFSCQMRVNGTPQLAGTFPTLMPSDRQMDKNCKIAERGGGRSDAARVMMRWVASDSVEVSLSGDYSSADTEPSVDAKLTQHSAGNFFNFLYDINTIQPKYGIRYTADSRFVTGDPFKTYAYPIDPVGGKNFPVNWISEEFKVQFRFSAYNVLNRVNRSAPNGDINNTGDFGRDISEQRRRQMEFALKLLF